MSDARHKLGECLGTTHCHTQLELLDKCHSILLGFMLILQMGAAVEVVMAMAAVVLVVVAMAELSFS